MSLINLINTLGDDATLLTRSDEWLERERQATAQKMDMLANELRAIMLAQRIKRLLQQKNLVAVQHLLKSEDGKVRDIIIRLMNLPDALQMLRPTEDHLEEFNRIAQIQGWKKDGYDIEASAALRSA